MAACFHSRRMITIFPVCPLPILPLIEFLTSSSRDELNGIRDYVSFAVVSDKKVDVVGGHHEVEHAQSEALLGFKKPLQISAAVSSKLQQKFLFMAAVGDMLNIPGNMMPIRPWHSQPLS
jgi:hypothetical protein